MTRDSARAEAAVWLARLQADDRTTADEAACEAWLRASPEHRRALAEVTAAWEAAGALGADPAMRARPARAHRLDRRAVLAGAGVALAAGGFWAVSAPRTYATEIGELRRLDLRDGSTAMLDTQSAIKVRRDFASRRIELLRGRVALTVAPGEKLPLVVGAEPRMIAVGGALEAARYDRDVWVTCLQGTMEVGVLDASPIRLAAGERLRVRPGAPPQKDSPPDAAAWRTGRLVFNDDTLAEAVEQINRYHRQPIIVDDPAAAALRLSGVYAAKDAGAFARSAADLLGLQVVEEAGGIRLRTGRPSAG